MKILFSVVLLSIACGVARAEDAAAPSFSDEQLAFFEAKVRPVLVASCYSCHSHENLAKNLKSAKGGIYMDGRKHILDAGLAEPGDLESSLIIEAVRYKDPTNQMPPDGKLPDNVIKDLERWVEMGLPWPDEVAPESGEVFDLDARREAHWAWQTPMRSEKLPAAPGLDDAANPIDRFIESRLAEEGLKPAPSADRTTLIRRVTLDLTGLPPTPDEIDAFVNDKSPDAYEKLIDRLLDSPRYGEKWARHWLDLVRYSETYGHEFDFNIPHAWKYRDYVIRALNDDVSYDRFVKEHIAGDLIEPRIHPQTKVNEAVKATGWWFMHEQTHGTTDVRQHEADRIDNQIDVMSKTFLGVTVACARCHDHKFDAISDEDYYSLAGYLQSSRQQEAYLDPQGKIGDSLKRLRAMRDQGQAAFSTLKAPAIEPVVIEHDASVLFEDFNDGSYDGWRTTGWAWEDKPTQTGQWDALSGMPQAVTPGIAHSGLLGDAMVGTLRSPEFDIAHLNIWVRVKGKGQINVIIDSYTMHRYAALLFEGYIQKKIDTKGKWQWVKLHDRRKLYAGKGLHRGHLEIIDDLTDAHLMVDEVRLGDAGAPPNPPTPIDWIAGSPHDFDYAELSKRIDAAADKTPAPERVLAMTDGSDEDSYVHIRGAWHGKGQTMPRRLLTALGGEEMPTPGQGSGRDVLARRIVDPGNPLTARVQVNRLWHHLFERGIVPTVDNLGYLGIAPSHLELLDHLAVTFVEDDQWSNKAMIKRIVMSRAYQRSSDKADAAAQEKDPNNVLLHRQNIRRMPAEAIRDSILFVSGSLNEKQYGQPVPVYLTKFMDGRGKPKSGPLDGQGRRSIYSSVRRNFLSPMMLAFDAPIPFSTVGKRNVSNVPAQALTLMNDPFVHDQATKWADRLVKDGSASPEQRIESMFRVALGRSPLESERDAALAFVNANAEQSNIGADRLLTDARPWRELCHAVYNLKGFVYVR